MERSKLMVQLQDIILLWDGTSLGNGEFGAKTFLHHGEEFGHIHQNGDIDIIFGQQLTAELLRRRLIQKHRYVPLIGITYPLTNEQQLSFAVSLLRFSYLVKLTKADATRDKTLERAFDELQRVS